MGASSWVAEPPWAVFVLPLWPWLTLPFALPLHHDVPVQSPGHSVGKLGALQECGHGAVDDAWAVGARLLSLTARPQAGPAGKWELRWTETRQGGS